jgi:hypothetical protein
MKKQCSVAMLVISEGDHTRFNPIDNLLEDPKAQPGAIEV